ncbi:E3 SUMO-protein ligase MMS21 [Hordeum vulgare]|nr:E3 SUMO-protein ligase MMS21 [Hordeum vulgare]
MSSAATKLATAADATSAEAQTLVLDMRKALSSMKALAVEYERAGKSDKVKQLEDAVQELVASYEECAYLAEAVKQVPGAYQPSDQATDFRKLIEGEVAKVKGTSRSSGHKDQLIRQFKEAVWEVHHAGQPMPGDEQEELVMTSTQNCILNMHCPLTLKPIVELENPVRCTDCRHIYDRDPILRYIRANQAPNCPVAGIHSSSPHPLVPLFHEAVLSFSSSAQPGCPAVLQAAKISCDTFLRMEIEEQRASGPDAPNASEIEDISDHDEDEDPMDDDDDE